jgi:sugar/nucleoside kinase (ribokinase family)
MSQNLSKTTAAALKVAAKSIAQQKVVVGFDGFVDTIIEVVKTRQSPTKFERYTTMVDWAKRITAASGLSANFELAVKMVKLGGNGPIMANALTSFDFATTYIGNLGNPNLHPVFADFAKRAKVVSIAEPGYTDAYEFDDGKLMCGNHVGLKGVNWKQLTAHISEAELVKLFSSSKLVAMVNWTMLMHLSEIFKKLLATVMPKLKGPKPWIFFDLTDPAKRSKEDIAEALKLISKFEKHARVILGLNLGEARQASEVLGLGPIDENYGTVAHASSLIRAKLKVDTVVIHPVQFAAGTDSTGSAHVEGPYCAKPKITTGAGDHFNAGFCLGRLAGLTLAESLQCGVGTSGYYVRTAKSPKVADLAKFLGTL